jgi:hypothetical protein
MGMHSIQAIVVVHLPRVVDGGVLLVATREDLVARLLEK